MLPGFSGLASATAIVTPTPHAPIRLAGLWDTPPGTCTYVETTTACAGLVLFCTEVYQCWNGQQMVISKKTAYPCGVCVGASNPSDW